MTVKKTITVAQIIPQYRETDGLGRRRLLTPDEILRFPNDELLIIIRGENVLRAKKFDYTRHPYAKDLVRSSVFNYNPSPQTENADSEVPQIEDVNKKTPQTENTDKEIRQAEPEGPPTPQTDKKPGKAKLYAASKPPEEF